MVNLTLFFRLSYVWGGYRDPTPATILENVFNASLPLTVEGYEASETKAETGRDYGMEQCSADG